MPLIRIGDVLSFAPNVGVVLHKGAMELTPEKLHEVVHLANSHMEDPLLCQACCGRGGPLDGCGVMQLDQYLHLTRELEAAAVESRKRLEARQLCLKARRSQFAIKRPDLVLALLNTGALYQCVTCGTSENLTVDHKEPVVRGGGDNPDNLQFLCRRHNSAKGARV